jgi:hypothetical protein
MGFCVVLVEIENLLDSGIVKTYEFEDFSLVRLIRDEMVDRKLECG